LKTAFPTGYYRRHLDFGVTTLQEVVHNLGGTHDAEQRSGISGKNLMGRREINDIGKERSMKEIQGS
jgi:hypothetical protein